MIAAAVLLFIKYVSDKYAGQPYAPITIPPGASFKDMSLSRILSCSGSSRGSKGPVAIARNREAERPVAGQHTLPAPLTRPQAAGEDRADADCLAQRPECECAGAAPARW
ncbi:MAG: hypothetical protein ABJA98_12670 [Acidobacteriota bacterium]